VRPFGSTVKRSFQSGDGPSQAEEQGARLWRSVAAAEWRRVGRWTELFPWTPLGVVLTALAYAALEWLAYGQLDLVWLVVGYVGLGLTLLAPLLVLVAAVWLRLSSPERAQRESLTGAPLMLETATYFETGFVRPSLWFLPLVQVRWEWLAPARAEVDLVRRDGMLFERVRLPERGHHERIERRMIVSDAFGLSRVRFRLHYAQAIEVLPRLGALRVMPPLIALASGDALSHPFGLSEGDRLELRRYEKGDPARFIHWKVYSRTGKLMVRMPERALSIARRMAAYVIAGEQDDASCGAARLAIDQRALGHEWVLGTDGQPGGVTRSDEALEAIVRSSEHAGAGAGNGLSGFVERVEQGGPASYVLFVPPKEGPWTASVARMARGRTVRIVIGVDGLTSPLKPSLWQRMLTVPSQADGVDPRKLEQLIAQLSALDAHVSVLDRTSGRALGAAHLLQSLRQQSLRQAAGPSGAYVPAAKEAVS
jgi:hypothetical protein